MSAEPSLSASELQRAYRAMSLARALDERMWRLARAGRAHFAVPCSGHEGVSVGYAMALQPGVDFVAPHYRDLAALLVLGMQPRDVMLHFFSRVADPNAHGRQPYAHFGSQALRIMSLQGPQPNHASHGVGAAWGSRILREPSVTVIAFGDGGAQKGEVHECMNFASIHDLPCVFVIHRNGYTQSVKSTHEYRPQNLSLRGAAYGMPGVSVDAMDATKMYAAAKTAVDRARAGAGPTLIDAVCYRFLPNTSNDDDTRYRSREEVETGRARDPLAILRGYVDAAFAAEVDLAHAAAADEAAEWAEAHPPGDPTTVMNHVYA